MSVFLKRFGRVAKYEVDQSKGTEKNQKGIEIYNPQFFDYAYMPSFFFKKINEKLPCVYLLQGNDCYYSFRMENSNKLENR